MADYPSIKRALTLTLTNYRRSAGLGVVPLKTFDGLFSEWLAPIAKAIDECHSDADRIAAIVEVINATRNQPGWDKDAPIQPIDYARSVLLVTTDTLNNWQVSGETF